MTCRRCRVYFRQDRPFLSKGLNTSIRQSKMMSYLDSGLGGTDVQTGLIEGTPVNPVYAGEMMGPSLGMKVNVYDENGKPVVNRQGELVCEKPFPSVPLYFWNDPNGERFKDAYFNIYPNVWRHGDYAMIHSETGGITAYGRSDSVLKPSGVRIRRP